MRRLVVLLVSTLLLVASPAADALALSTTTSSMELETLPLRHLPSWVQAAAASVPLYRTDGGSQLVAANPLIRHTYMRILGGGAARLLVQVYDENGSDTSVLGWVDPWDVLPSAPATDWLVSSKSTVLWRSAENDAEVTRRLDAFTPLQLLDGPIQNRVRVRVFGSDFRLVDEGWIEVGDTGAALPPQTRVPAPSGQSVTRAPSGPGQQQTFLDATAQAARSGSRLTGVPASITVAQAILESDWGRSLLARDANNYFGIKAMGSLGSDGVVWMPTSEYDSAGQLYETISPFRAYKSLVDSITDHDRLLGTSSRYAKAMGSADNPRQFAVLLYEAGYSTDPAYPDKLVALMDRYDLYRFDA